eukprot:105232-Prymnesium_polylepis.1
MPVIPATSSSSFEDSDAAIRLDHRRRVSGVTLWVWASHVTVCGIAVTRAWSRRENAWFRSSTRNDLGQACVDLGQADTRNDLGQAAIRPKSPHRGGGQNSVASEMRIRVGHRFVNRLRPRLLRPRPTCAAMTPASPRPFQVPVSRSRIRIRTNRSSAGLPWAARTADR